MTDEIIQGFLNTGEENNQKNTKKNYKDRVLHIEFNDDEKQIYNEWKKNVLGQFGHGYIRKRVIELLTKDRDLLNSQENRK